VINAFTLDGSSATMGFVDTQCINDYVAIPGTKALFRTGNPN
jgi:hypothetical protein